MEFSHPLLMFLNEMNGLCEMKEMFELTKKITMNKLNDYLDCNIYTSADTGKRLYHTDVINAIKNYKG